MNRVYDTILDTIGNTPIVKLNKVTKDSKHQFFAKIEYFNPGGSVKDRVALNFITEAEKRGELVPGGTIIEATSGNTGVGLAMVAALKGYKCIFVMPDKISEEKRALLRGFGAKVIITPTGVEPDDPRSHLSVAKTLVRTIPNAFCSNQYHNPDNTSQHYRSTGPEILKQMDGKIDVFVAGAGTGGTISGVGKFLKEKIPAIQIVCADPIGSILYDLFYHKKVITPPAPYKVEGVGEDMLPDNTHLDVMDAFERVSDKDAFLMTRKLTLEEGLCVGPSSAMALVGAIRYSEKLVNPSNILVLFPDNGRGYLSKAFNDEWMADNGFLESALGKRTLESLLPNLQKKPRLNLQIHANVHDAYQAMKTNNCNELLVYEKASLLGLVQFENLVNALVKGQLKSHDSIIHLVESNYTGVGPDMRLEAAMDILNQNKNVVLECGDHAYLLNKSDFVDFLI